MPEFSKEDVAEMLLCKKHRKEMEENIDKKTCDFDDCEEAIGV